MIADSQYYSRRYKQTYDAYTQTATYAGTTADASINIDWYYCDDTRKELKRDLHYLWRCFFAALSEELAAGSVEHWWLHIMQRRQWQLQAHICPRKVARPPRVSYRLPRPPPAYVVMGFRAG